MGMGVGVAVREGRAEPIRGRVRAASVHAGWGVDVLVHGVMPSERGDDGRSAMDGGRRRRCHGHAYANMRSGA
jgi:hypothetical protein